MKVEKSITLSAGSYKSIRIGVSDVESFEEADKIIKEELKKMPEIVKMNSDELKKMGLL